MCWCIENFHVKFRTFIIGESRKSFFFIVSRVKYTFFNNGENPGEKTGNIYETVSVIFGIFFFPVEFSDN